MKKLAVINKQFIKAVKNNQIDKIKNLLDQGADIHADNDWALRDSAADGHLEIVKFLVLPDLGSVAIAHGANVHVNNDESLRRAAHNGHLEIVKFLITQGANIHANHDEALRLSANNGYLEIVKFLVTKGANIHADDDYALRLSARNGRLEIVKFLLTQGANIHADDDYALKWAEHLGNDDVWQVLSAFIQEENLLVAASVSMPLVAAVGSVLLIPAIKKSLRAKI